MSEEFAHQQADRMVFAPAALESPSLLRNEPANGEPAPAFEIKFLLTEAEARIVESRIQKRMALDSHADPRLNGAYRITSLYTETPDFAVFRRVGEYGRTKFRIRRYGSSAPVFLERKDKRGDKVRKSRVAVPGSDLTVFTGGELTSGWAGSWFRDQIVRRRLAPVCRVSYDRTAYLGVAETGPIRVTFDRSVRGEPAADWEVAPVRAKAELLPEQVICEFKFRMALPLLLKEILESMELQPSPCSKYRRFILYSGIAGSCGGAENGDAADV